jgi:UDP-galactopyranose mutase
MHDVIVVGSGFAGAVSANLLATKHNKKVLVLEEREHIGGNCYDYVDDQGIRIHKYGPHLFHTSNQEVWDYLSKFTQWQKYEHKVLAHIENQNVPIPFNFNTIRLLFTSKEAQELIDTLLTYYSLNTKVPILELKKHSNKKLQKLADFVYNKVFVGYTSKQWGLKPEELDSAVTARVPIFIGEDNRYFNDTYQAVPKEGYTKLFENLLTHPNITIQLSTPFVLDPNDKKQIIYTGMIDALFDYRYGELPYRSTIMQLETVSKEFFQEAATINYPNDHDFTRITEFRHIHPSKSKGTTILKEYPQTYEKEKNTPYYPIFTDENQKKYQRYLAHAQEFPNLILLGRLAEYKYYDMDDIVERVLQTLGALL